MTEQQAAEQFKERLAIPDYKGDIPEYYEAMEMAVKALENSQNIKKENDSLKRRCNVFTHGQLCLFCPIEECESRSVEYRGSVDNHESEGEGHEKSSIN